MTEFVITVFIFTIFVMMVIDKEKRKGKYKNKKNNWKYNNTTIKKYKQKEYFYKDTFADIGKNNPSYNQVKILKAINTAVNIKNEFEKKETVPENRKKDIYQDNIEKGKNYEEYIANYFRENGYYVWEHGKEKGMKDSSIDLIIKKEEYIYFVQCKNWEKWKIDHKEVKATRTDVREYLKNNGGFYNLVKNYKQKILYVTSKDCLTAGAYTYIEENKEILEYKVIPMEA